MSPRSLIIVAILVLFLTSTYTVAGAQKALISVSDPTGDDKGPGYYGYPGNNVFKPGVFDMTGFEVVDAGDKLVFKVYFKDLGGNPWNGPNGFCLQYVHIYVHTTMTGVPARLDTLGLNVVLRSDYAWHFALLLAPGWEESPVPVGQRAALYYANGTIVVQDDVFRVYADTNENAVVAEVSKSLIPDLDNIAQWSIVVAVASYDGFGPMRVRPVGVAGGEWVLNGTRYATPEQAKKIAPAIAAGIEPRVLDLAVYSPDYPEGVSAETQYKWLDSFDVENKLLATIPALTATTVTKTTTVTVTETVEKTVTSTTTTTAYKTVTTEKTVEKTVTRTTTATETSTTTATTTVKETNWTVTGALAVLLFIIGLAIGYVARRS